MKFGHIGAGGGLSPHLRHQYTEQTAGILVCRVQLTFAEAENRIKEQRSDCY